MASKIVKTAISNFEQASINLEVDFKETSKNLEMMMRYHHQLNECEVGRLVVLFLLNGKTYVGIFNGINDGSVILKSTKANVTIGFQQERLGHFLESKSVIN